MPRMSQSDYVAHELKVSQGKGRRARLAGEHIAGAKHHGIGPMSERETGKGGLHEQIMRHCDSQWPRWKYLHSRTDQKSTVAVGSHDFTVFLPGSKHLCIECKSKSGKLSSYQLGWAHEMRTLGHEVHVVYSLDQFLELTK